MSLLFFPRLSSCQRKVTRVCLIKEVDIISIVSPVVFFSRQRHQREREIERKSTIRGCFMLLNFFLLLSLMKTKRHTRHEDHQERKNFVDAFDDETYNNKGNFERRSLGNDMCGFLVSLRFMTKFLSLMKLFIQLFTPVIDLDETTSGCHDFQEERQDEMNLYNFLRVMKRQLRDWSRDARFLKDAFQPRELYKELRLLLRKTRSPSHHNNLSCNFSFNLPLNFSLNFSLNLS